MAIKFGKLVQSLEGFFKATTLALQVNFFCFCFGQILFNLGLVRLQCITNKALFLLFLRSILMTYLITFSLGKEIIVLDKGLEKALNFGSKTLYGP